MIRIVHDFTKHIVCLPYGTGFRVGAVWQCSDSFIPWNLLSRQLLEHPFSERSGQRAESADHSPLQPNLSLTL